MSPLRVLVVDDSTMSRRTLIGLLSKNPDVEVVGSASDGDEALRMAAKLEPGLITLDLEMPRMDGFTFLRLLMASRPTPVIVVSSRSAKENVFRALELGALDFIAKPTDVITDSSEALRRQIDRMVDMVRHLSPASIRRNPIPAMTNSERAARESTALRSSGEPEKLVVVASSTGGPTALLEMFSRLPGDGSAAIIVAQHMPDRFTKTFAERLNRQSAFEVGEADGIQQLEQSSALVCPGGKCIEVLRRNGQMASRVCWPDETDRYAPSADRLFKTAAEVAGERVVAVVLTGMGDDGSAGISAIKDAGGLVVAESEETAVVYGMPKAAQKTGCVDEILALPRLIDRVKELVS